MFAPYLRIVFTILALIGAVVLFAFAFTTGAIVIMVLLLVGLFLGRRPGSQVWVFRREGTHNTNNKSGPVVIDHDPNDLPPDHK